jgi:hypothetical protein
MFLFSWQKAVYFFLRRPEPPEGCPANDDNYYTHTHTEVKSDCHKCARKHTHTHTQAVHLLVTIFLFIKKWMLFVCGKRTLWPRILFKECISVYYSVFLRHLFVIANAIWLSALGRAGRWQTLHSSLRAVCHEKYVRLACWRFGYRLW